MGRDSDEYDFFVSYARADDRDGWISGFVEELLAVHKNFTGGRKLTPFFDRQEIRGLDDWRHRLYQGLSRSRLFLAFVSPNYFASEWCRREWRTWIDVEISKHVLSAGAAPLYIVEIPGLLGSVSEQDVARQIAALCKLPAPHDAFVSDASSVVHQLRRRQFSAVQPFFNAGVAALRRDDLRSVMEALARDLDERAAAVEQAALSETTVPPYNRNFSGRVDELLELREQLKDNRAGVISGIHGLGGIGKTELAFTYAHAFAGAYPGGRFLIPCEGISSLQQATVVLGDLFRARIDDEERKHPERHFGAILRCLRQRVAEQGHVLLVLDNLTDPDLLSPRETDRLTALGPKLHLLATTRLAAGVTKHVAWLTLGELSEEAALELLDKHRSIGEEYGPARRIVRQLGGFALAVELVGAYLAVHPSTTYPTLADGWKLDDLDLMAADRDVELRRHDHERRLQAVLGPTLEALSAPERLTVGYASCLAPDAVPLTWLRQLVLAEHPELDVSHRLGDPWEELWRRLMRLAIFSRAVGEGHQPRVVRMHRLVQDLVRRDLSGTLHSKYDRVEALIDERIQSLDASANRQAGKWEVEALDALSRRWDEDGLGRAWLMSATGRLWCDLAEWARAESLVRRSLEIRERSLGPDQFDVTQSLVGLARILFCTNRLPEAEELLRESLAIRERDLGPDHPDVAFVLNNLATLCQASNRPADAEALLRRSLTIGERSLGPDHSDLAASLANLAAVLAESNRLIEAEPLYRRSLAIQERSLGPAHPNVANCLNNLAMLLKVTKRLPEAESLLRRALAIREQSLGSNHPDVGACLNNLASLLNDTNRRSEAEPLFRRSLAIIERSLGPYHPDVASPIHNLARLFTATNRLSEAEQLYRQSLAISERSLGPIHPDVASSLYNLARLLTAPNQISEADALYRRSLAICEQSLGPEHPKTTACRNQLAALRAKVARLPVPEQRLDSPLESEKEGAARTGDETPPVSSAYQGGLGSIPHPTADANHAMELNFKYQVKRAAWNALPWWKRWFVRPPSRPKGI